MARTIYSIENPRNKSLKSAIHVIYGIIGLIRGIRHRNLAAIKMATQRGINQLQGPGDKEYQYTVINWTYWVSSVHYIGVLGVH